MYPVNFTEKMSVNLTHAHTVCTRPSLSQREGPGDEATETPEFMRGASGVKYTFLSPRFTAPLVCEPYYLSMFLCSSPSLTCNIIFIVITF